MNARYSLASMLTTTPGVSDSETFGGAGTDPAAILSQRLQGLQRLKASKLHGQSQSPLGENAPGFYDDMAAINQAIPALGQAVARPGKGIQFAPDRGRQSTINPVQAGWAHERAVDDVNDARISAGTNRRLAALSRQGGY